MQVRDGVNVRQALEQLCSYIARPALADEHVQTKTDGQGVLKLKTRWRDGTTQVVISPL
ncbi:MAG: transposase [Rubrivivax sp.]|nr:transposase [Rubrivivax sp.]